MSRLMLILLIATSLGGCGQHARAPAAADAATSPNCTAAEYEAHRRSGSLVTGDKCVGPAMCDTDGYYMAFCSGHDACIRCDTKGLPRRLSRMSPYYGMGDGPLGDIIPDHGRVLR